MDAQAAGYTAKQQRLISSGGTLVRDAVLLGSADAKVDLARVLVDLRELFEDSRGRPDYAGKSYAYREAANAVYEASTLDRKRTAALRTSVRHQVGLELRKRLTPEQLADYGLNTYDRNTPRRKGESAPASDGVDDSATLPARVTELRTLVRALADAPDVSTLDSDTAAALRATLAETVELCEKLRARLAP
ncbi:hypothetical protein [Amycolatopsis sp. NPDC059021]|uniref:hypothetical protein n=1 Tax=Amycolatopsis sp. NPDC059021 TaxID=3346704 RepID=UPI00366E0596